MESKSNYFHQIRIPKLTDKELIAINLTAGYMSIYSEYQLFRILSQLFSKIERSVYNRRKRKFFPFKLKKIVINVSST